jgi:hypothetical protein
MPRVSVALCTHNGERFLREQLESLARQTLAPHELVVRDDASADGTLGIVDAFARGAPFPVRAARNAAALGPAKNFERAIAACAGDLIALADQDDVWLPGKLATMARAFDAADVAYAFSDARVVDEALRPLSGTLLARRYPRTAIERAFRERRELDLLLKRDFVYGTTLMFRADARDIVLPIPGSWSQDSWTVNVLAGAGRRGVPVLEPLVLYRQHAAQGSGGFAAPRPVPYGERTRAYDDLRARLAGLAATPAVLARIDDKLAYLRALERIERLPPHRRLLPALREVASGRWWRYSPRTFRREYG